LTSWRARRSGGARYRELDKVGNTQDVSRFPAPVTVVEKGTGV
jgi:hypothetical protein